MKVKVDDFYTYELAGIGTRWFALIIDYFILGIAGMFVGFGAGSLWGGGTVTIILGAIYHWYFLTQHDGQTPGKMVMGIKVVSIAGGKISDLDAILRYIGYHVNDLIFGLGWLWACFDHDRQGWHDKLARTYVVRVRPAERGDTLYVDPTGSRAANGSGKRKNEVI